MYVFGCRLSLFRLCDIDFGITPVDDITNGINYLLLIIIIITTNTTYLLTYLLTAIEFSLGGSNPYTVFTRAQFLDAIV